MPRIKQLLTYVEDLKSLSIKDIKRYLKPNTTCGNDVLSYYRYGGRARSLGVKSDISETEGVLILSCEY